MEGRSIRYIRRYDAEKDRFMTVMDLALQSCRQLGHTFMTNIGETDCGVCGALNPVFDGASITVTGRRRD